VRGKTLADPRFGPRGLFRFTRQSRYAGFSCALWTALALACDRLLLATLSSLYCLLGRFHEERRALVRDSDGYGGYRQREPSWRPRLTPRRLEI
jgi:protein-S-isoprenylcysteine O-methyltransferase Ste14